MGVSIPGLAGPVTAVSDENGLLHLSCTTDEDCFATLGYFHAQNRFFFMDFVRNSVRGKLAKLVKAGDTVLANDYANRQFFATSEGKPLEEELYDDASPATKGYIDAYTRGVNAWIGDMRAAKNGATLTKEYDFPLIVKENIRDWEPEDSAAVGLYVLNDLSNNSNRELSMAQEIPAHDPAFAADLFSPAPVFAAFTQPAGNQVPFAPPPVSGGGFSDGLASAHLSGLLGDARAKLKLVGGREQAASGDIGSNNWAVGPGRTASGNAILANDPHLLLTNPSIWFPVEMDAVSAGTGKIHTAGSTFPGLPSTMVGQNESLAWGVTTAYYDLADVYVEQLSADGSTVSFNGQNVPVLEKSFDFEDADSGTTITKTFRWVPHHGPIVSEDAATHTALSVRWRGHEGGTDLDAFFGLAKAKNLAEAKTAVENGTSASQNYVIVDKAGDIGWFPYSQVPARPWASSVLAPWLPLPGDGSAEWGPPVPFADLPQLENPPAGAIATANADMTGASADGDILNDGQAALQSITKADGAREQRILDLLDAGANAHSVDTLVAMQGDTFSLYGELVVPFILAAEAGQTLTSDEQALIDALSVWAYTCPTGLVGSDPATATDSTDPLETAESIGCSAFHATLYALVQASLGDEIAASGVPLSSNTWDLQLVARALKDPASIGTGEALWDDVSTVNVVETRDDMLRAAVSVAAQHLAVTGAPNTWRWGRLHALTLRSIYASFGIDTYNEGPYAAPGGLFTVNVANPRNRAVPADGKPWEFGFSSGPSVRFVVEVGADGPHMSYQLPGGADLHRESPFFNNLLPNWLINKPIPFPFGPGAVTNPASTVVVSPI